MPFSDKRPQILVMENGLNLDTAIRTGNLAIVSDQYTVHCRPLYKAVFGHTSANVSNGGWTESRHSYFDRQTKNLQHIPVHFWLSRFRTRVGLPSKNLILNCARGGTVRVSAAHKGYLYFYRGAEFCSTNCESGLTNSFPTTKNLLWMKILRERISTIIPYN